MREEIRLVTIPNTNDKNMFGILHVPEKPNPDVGIIILSPGIKNRVGPHRLYVKMAKAFEKLGLYVLRADPEGLGNSEGEFEQDCAADVYYSIEIGYLVPDTITMMNWMEENLGIKKFILTGLCGGSITALLTSFEDDRVSAILALGIPSVLSKTTADQIKYISDGQINSIREKYLKKIFNVQAWLRFLCFKSDYKLIFKSILKPLNNKFKKKTDPIQCNLDIDNLTIPENSNLNPQFPKAFIKFVEQKKMLLLFSEADRLFWEFDEKFLREFKTVLSKYKDNYKIEIIKNANHVFSFKKWQTEMLEKACFWLKSIIKTCDTAIDK